MVFSTPVNQIVQAGVPQEARDRPQFRTRRYETGPATKPASQRRNAPDAILVRQERYGRTRERIFPILTRVGRLGAVVQRDLGYADG